MGVTVPFDDHILWHLHVAGVTAVAVVFHVVSALLIIGENVGESLLPFTTGVIAVSCGAVATGVGVLYVGFKLLSFPRFIWLHRLGYGMIVVAIPVHVWPTLRGSCIS